MKYANSHEMKGKHARTPKGFKHNIKHMEKEGYSEKRAVGSAYGEADRKYSPRKVKGEMTYDQTQKLIRNL